MNSYDLSTFQTSLLQSDVQLIYQYQSGLMVWADESKCSSQTQGFTHACCFVHAEGPLERIYIDAQGSTVKFCPGDRTHFEVMLRQGFTDMGALNSFLAHERHSEFADFVVLTPAQSGRPVT